MGCRAEGVSSQACIRSSTVDGPSAQQYSIGECPNLADLSYM